MRFSLRTLLIFMLIAGPLCAVGWQQWQLYQARREVELVRQKIQNSFSYFSGVGRKIPKATATQNEIWEKYQDNFAWESFPESQPPQRVTPPSAATSGD